MHGPKQFVIPIYQRKYSWTEKQCKQLWDDIVNVAKNDAESYFLGSIVYIEKGLYQASSDVTQLLVIDGQQRLTTISLLLAALRNVIGGSNQITREKINDYFLFNLQEPQNKYKIIPTDIDKATLEHILDTRPCQEKHSVNMVNNYEFFSKLIAKNNTDVDMLYRGISKLSVVDISLDSRYDNPQLIFESLNSTGLNLSQADLIRNFVLMRLDRSAQERIYTDFWRPMEENFVHSGSFDNFMRDYLTIRTGKISNIRDVYSDFKEYVDTSAESIDEIALDIHHLSEFYGQLVRANTQVPQLNTTIRYINTLKVDVAYPFLLQVLLDFDSEEITKEGLVEVFMLVESYVFRRAICDLRTNSLNKIFANLYGDINKNNYIESVKAAFALMKFHRRFPNNEEFRKQFTTKDVYNSKNRKYILDRLENFERKEYVNVNNYTIEHIMPQNKRLSEKWKLDLGENWEVVHDKYLHTIGNLTLTGYNSELSNKSFAEKRDMRGGFKNSPIQLNSDLATLEHWNENKIQRRAEHIADKALRMWRFPDLSPKVLSKYMKTDDESDDEDDEDESIQWEELLTSASDEVQRSIAALVTTIKDELECEVIPQRKWLFFYVSKPVVWKHIFAILICGKNTANVAFRVDPETFDGNKNVRTVAGWFFPKNTERRMSIKEELIPQIVQHLHHSYDITNIL